MIWKIALLEIIWLVVLTILKNMKVLKSGKDYPIYISYIMETKKCMTILLFKNDDSQRPKATSLEMLLVSDWKFSLPSLVAWLLRMDCFEGTPTLNRESVVFTTIRKKNRLSFSFSFNFSHQQKHCFVQKKYPANIFFKPISETDSFRMGLPNVIFVGW